MTNTSGFLWNKFKLMVLFLITSIICKYIGNLTLRLKDKFSFPNDHPKNEIIKTENHMTS